MKGKINSIFNRLAIFAIAIGLCLTAIQIGAISTTSSQDSYVKTLIRKNIPNPIKLEKSELNIPLTSNQIIKSSDIPVVSSEDDETLTTFGENLIFGGFTRQFSLFEKNIDFIYSDNGGSSWEIPSGLNPEIGIIDYLAIDALGSGVVVTFQPDPSISNGAEQWRIIMTDPIDTETWDGAVWDWASANGYSDLKTPDIAGYDFNGEGPSWYYGWMIGSVDNSLDGFSDAPTFFFANGEDEGSGWIWDNRDPTSSSTHSSVDVDLSTGRMYSAWENYNITDDE